MNLSRLKNYFQAAKEIESLPQLRQRILDRFLLGATAIGTILFAISWIPLYQKGLFSTIGMYGLIYIFTLLITFIRRIPYWIRVGGYLLLFYLFGVINLSMSGFNVDAGLFLLVLVAMAILLIGTEGGIAAIGLSLVTITIMGFLVDEGIIKLSLGLPQRDPLLWIIGVAVFLMMCFLMILGFVAVVNGLETNLAKANELSKNIERAYAEQEESEERYRALIEGSTDIITILTREGIIKFVSPSVEFVLGFTPEEVNGLNVFNLIHPDDRPAAYDALGPDVPAERIGPKLDLRLQHKDGNWRDLEVRGREMYSTPGIQGTIINCRDITVRKQALAELRESTLFLERMFSGLRDGVFINDIQSGKILDCNEAALEIFGYKREEVLGQALTIIHLDNGSYEDFFHKQTESMETRGFLTHFEFLFKRKDGSHFPAEISVTPLNDSQGETRRWVSVIRDISERKLSERLLAEEREALKQDVFEKTSELQKSNERLQELVVLSSSVVYSLGTKGEHKINFITENVEAVLGYTSGEILSDPGFWKQKVHPEDRERLSSKLRSAIKRGEGVFEYRFKRRDGTYLWIHDEIRTIRDNHGNLIDLVGSWYDVTERIKAEEALRASEIKYRSLYTGMMDAFVSVNMDGNIVEFNDMYQKMLGYSADELQKLTYKDLTPNKWHSMEDAMVEEQILPRGYSDVYEKEYIRKDGSVFPVELRTMVIQNKPGSPTGMWAIVRDISERKQIEKTLHTSEERYRTLAEASHDMIFIIDRQDRIQYVNTFAALSFHSNPKDLIGRPRSEIFKSSVGDRQKENLDHVFQTGEALYVENASDFPGNKLWLSTWLVPFKDSTGNLSAVLGVSRDISEKKKTEETLLHFSEKLEEKVAARTSELLASQVQLRTLANEIVRAQEDERRRISRELHDEAGQALISLKYNLDTIAGEIPVRYQGSHRKLTDSVKIIDQTMDMIRNLSHSLRPPVMDVGGLNLSLRELCWDFSQRTRLKIQYKGQDIPGLPDEIAISLYRFVQETMVNILKHADATKVNIWLKHEKEYLILSVTDNGKGMNESRSSDGIGLMGIAERIDLLGGHLDIQSKPGRGVHLIARIPWADKPRT
jgi:PAS domain S-box-containing protein